MTPLSMFTIGCGLALLPFLSVGSEPAHPASSEALASDFAGPRYIGAKVCKNCHNGEEKGDIHTKWAAGPHAKAYETLASDDAKKIAEGLGIEDAQKSDKCLKCHVTAFGVDKKKGIKRGFKVEFGVQCESCHGPGEEHFKVRFKESQKGGDPAPIGPTEVSSGRDPAQCITCHNDESPTYKPFCFKERMAQMEHLDPRRERSEEELKAMREICTPDCPKCSKEKTDKDG